MAMKFQFAVSLVLVAFAGVAFAAPPPKFTRNDAHARLSTVLAARPTSGTECVACEDVLGQVIHQAIEMGWMTLSMTELCPKLAQYGIPEEACALIAFLFMTDMLEHIMPDPVLYCEKLHICPSLPGGAAQFTAVNVVQVRQGGGS